MIKKISISLILTIAVIGSSFSQEKEKSSIEIKPDELVLLVRVAEKDPSIGKIVSAEIEELKLLSQENDYSFYFSLPKEGAESTSKKVKDLLSDKEMKVKLINGEEYKKMHVKK